MFSIEIVVSFQVPGMHNWPDASASYFYLSLLHRHEFHVQVRVRVTDANREVEIIEFKEIARKAFLDLTRGQTYCNIPDFGGRSCEQMGKELIQSLHKLSYDVRSVTVLEDGENGAAVEYKD